MSADIRSIVTELERGIEKRNADLVAFRAQFEEATTGITTAEQDLQVYRTTLAEARRELVQQETLEAAQERSRHLDADLDSMVSSFLDIAKDKLWFTGTDGDSILPHQWQAAQFGAVARRWILGDGVGLGKTRDCIAWLDLIGAKRVLIVCEPNIVNQFAGEVMELAPHRQVFNLYKKTPEKKHAILDSLPSEGVVIVNFEVWRRDKDIIAKLIQWEIDTIIVDEAHNLKTTSTANFTYLKTLIAVDNICPNCGGPIMGLYDPEKLREKPSRKVAQPCPHCEWKINVHEQRSFDDLMASRSVKNVCLTTGTPIINDPLDLFSLLHLLNPILFPTKAAFQREYLTNNYHSGKWEFREGAMTKLKPMLSDILLARTLEDTGVTLPPQHVNVIPVELDKQEYPLQYRTIRQISDAAMIVLDSGEEASIMNLMSLITRKRQANVLPAGIKITDTRPESPTYGEILLDVGSEVQESVKLDQIQASIVKYQQLGHRQIVFSQFKTALAEFEQRLAATGLRVVRFDGDTTPKLRTEIKADFAKGNLSPRWDVVLMNYKTGGTGVNLQGATVTHILDEEWGPGKRDQAYGRTHRMGQENETQVFVYRIPGTIDTWMSNSISRKEALIQGFKEGMNTTDLAEDFKTALQNGEIL